MKPAFESAKHQSIRSIKSLLAEDVRNYLNRKTDQVGEKSKVLIDYVLRSGQTDKLKDGLQARILTNSCTRWELLKIREITNPKNAPVSAPKTGKSEMSLADMINVYSQLAKFWEVRHGRAPAPNYDENERSAFFFGNVRVVLNGVRIVRGIWASEAAATLDLFQQLTSEPWVIEVTSEHPFCKYIWKEPNFVRAE